MKRGQKKRTRLGRIRWLDVYLPLFAKDIPCFCYLSLSDAAALLTCELLTTLPYGHRIYFWGLLIILD